MNAATARGATARQADSRAATVRRLYFYIVALISATAALAAFDGLVDVLADSWLGGAGLFVLAGPFARTGISWSAAVLIVATPIFLIHWGLIQGSCADPGERAAAMRKFFLYAASAIALGYSLTRGWQLLGGLARLALGEPPASNRLLPESWIHYTVVALAAGLLYLFWQRTARRDGDFGFERGVAGTWRRLFQGALGVAGLVLLVFGSAWLLDALGQLLINRFSPTVGRAWFAVEAGDGLALMIVGAAMVRHNWWNWQAIVAARPDEADSPVRRLYFYVAVIAGALATLVPAATVLRELLLRAFGVGGGGAMDLVSRMVEPLAFVPGGLAVWLWHWGRLQREEERYGAGPGAAQIRRIYYYAVSATGLALLWIGANNVVQVLLDLAFTTDALKLSELWQRPLANGLSLLAVGAPVWALHWRAVQRVAREGSPAGSAERGALPRRIYLYGVALVGALLILFYLGQVVYRVLLWVLGDRSFEAFSVVLVEDLARSVIAAVLWLLHVLALRADGRLGAEAEFDLRQRRARLEARVGRLEQDLAEARRELAELDESVTSFQ